MEPLPSTISKDILWDFIDDNKTTYNFCAHKQEFLPKPAFDEATQRYVIDQILSQDDEVKLKDKLDLAIKVHKTARKLFLTCVYCSFPMSILQRLLDNNLSDSDFPLTIDKQPDWGQSEKQKFRVTFLPTQKLFNVPYFELHSFYNLDDTFPMPIEFSEDDCNLRGRGAFGKVWEVEIHVDQHGFILPKGHNHRFAMKVIQHKGSIARERKFSDDVKNLEHDHLVKCFTSWNFGAKYYMIYELAACNLEEFIQKHKFPRKHPDLTTSWFIKQLCGIAGALRAIHDQESKDEMLGVPNPIQLKSGYIHDIKPGNILVFIYGKTHWLRLSDFGCAKVVDFIASISGQHNVSQMTASKSGTPDYRPPESMKKKTSRPYDLWSLGCVYLELFVWFLQGYPALAKFRENRAGTVRPGGCEDEAFYFTEEDTPNPKFELRKAVTMKMDELSEIRPERLTRLFDVIPTLLKIEPTQRPKASVLVQRLKPLDTGTPLELELEYAKASSAPTHTLSPSGSSSSDESDSDTNQYVVVHKPTDEESK